MRQIRSLKVKIAASQIGFILLIAVALGSANYFSTVRLLKEAEQRHLQDIVENVHHELDEALEQKKQVLKQVCGQKVLKVYSESTEEKLVLKCFLDSMPPFSELSYVNKEGKEEIKLVQGKSSQDLFDISRTKLFQKIKEEPNTVFVTLETSQKKPAQLYLKFGILHQNFFDEFLGIVTAKIPFSEIIAEMGNIKIGETGFFMILGQEGKILWHPRKEEILKTASFAGKLIHTNNDEGRTDIKSGFARAEIMGIDSYIAYSTVEAYNWTILVILPYKEFIAKPNQIRNMGLLFSAIILLLGTLSSIALAGRINKPINELVAATQSLGRGDLSKRVTITTSDEIGRLSESFNKMAEDLERTTTSITRLNKEIAERKKAEEEIKKKAKHIESLYEIGKKITSMISKEDLLPWIALQAQKLLEVDACSFRIREGDYLVRGGGTELGKEVMKKERLKIGESFSGKIAEEKRSLVIENLRDDRIQVKEQKAVIKELGLTSFLGVPMLIEDRVIGVIGVYSKKQRTFSREDIKLLSSFAHQSAIAIENARLFKNLEEAKEEIEKSEKMLKEFSGKILSIREEEKRRLSIDLHDEVGTMTIALNSYLCIAEKKIEDGDFEEALQYIYKSRSLMNSATEKLKNLAAEMRPTELDIVGLPAALKKYFSDINEREEFRIDFREKIDKEVLDDHTAIVLYRVAQEAVNNIIKHADANTVRVRLSSTNHCIKFDIRDDGKGFEPKKGLSLKKKALKMGVIGMRERVESLRGTFLIESSPKKGTHIQVILPVNKE
jgi:signal transduction histidine kinase